MRDDKQTVLILANADIGLYKFRKEVVKRLLEEYNVCVCVPRGEYVDRLIDLGCDYIETPIDRRGMNPFKDIKLMLSYRKIIKRLRPKVVLTYTVKPNIYGGIACRIMKTPYMANITGLGTALENGGVLSGVLRKLYKFAVGKASCVFFQNEQNCEFFKSMGAVFDNFRIIPGSGVNLSENCFEEYPVDEGKTNFLFVGRIMREKGIDEFLQAAAVLRADDPNICFWVVGPMEDDYTARIEELAANGTIEYFGLRDDVHEFIKKSHALVNPSYHEGMSNVLQEAAACGRPVLASQISGCKETFDEGVTGIGFEPQNADDLIAKLRCFIDLPYGKKREMGAAARAKMEDQFDRNKVINAYINEISKIN